MYVNLNSRPDNTIKNNNTLQQSSYFYIILYMTKLIIQIPCFNEEQTLLSTLNDLPKEILGIDEIEVLVINDGSCDKSEQIALEWGASVISLPCNKGLANAFRVGLQESLTRNADIIVNTDADNQYCAQDIEKLVIPILNKEADIVVGARDILAIQEFSVMKKLFQKLGSAVLRVLSSTSVKDAPSGFRAFSAEAAMQINVFDNYTYTMETLIQAGAKGLNVVSVPIRVNPNLRTSRLVKNIFDYIYKSTTTSVRMFIIYRPFRFFITFSLLSGLLGTILVLRFLYFYFLGYGNGHIQSLIFAAIFLLMAVQLGVIAIIGDLFSVNRKLLEDIQTRVKIMELKK